MGLLDFPDLTDPQEASSVPRAPGRVAPLACLNLGAGNRPRSWSLQVTRFPREVQTPPDKPLEKRAGAHRCNSTFGAAPLGNPEPSLTLIETRTGGLAGTARHTSTRLMSNGIIPDSARFPSRFTPD
jgi:hypothetical protein